MRTSLYPSYPPYPPCPPRRLLIVEDDQELHTVLARSAQRQCPDLEVDWACDLDTARRLLTHHRYDAVLADYRLGPNERGTEIQRWCRTRHLAPRIAIMSSTPLAELMECVPDASTQLLPKPFTTREFGDFVASLLDTARRSVRSRRPPADRCPG
ncbi:MAG: response regulator [bacterium]|nr:response regulator [bacterium]